MARNLNSVTLLGALSRKAELKYTAGGLAILEIPLAGIERDFNENGEPIEFRWYHQATIFGRQAEDLVDDLHPGTIAFVQGRLNYRSWQDRGTGMPRSNLGVNAFSVQISKPPPNIDDLLTLDSRDQPLLAIGGINRVEITGTLDKDPDYRLLPNQDYGVNKLTVTVNDEYRDRDGNQQVRTHMVDVELWRDLAAAASTATAGSHVFITGRLKTHTWEDKNNKKHYVNRLNASSFAELTPDTQKPATRTTAAASSPARTNSSSTLDIDEDLDSDLELPF